MCSQFSGGYSFSYDDDGSSYSYGGGESGDSCWSDCDSCFDGLAGICLDDCEEGTSEYASVVERCCFQESYSFDFNPFAFSPCPAQAIVSTSIGFAGLACAAYTAAEEVIVIAAVASNVDGVEPEHIGSTQCADDASRRALLDASSSATISFDITVRVSFDRSPP